MKNRGIGVKLLQGFLALIVVLAAVGTAVWLIMTKPETKRQKIPKIELLVETVEAERAENRIVIEAMGSVITDEEVAINPEVSGLVVWKNPNLIEGGIIREDEPLLRIDQRNYAVAVRQAEANLEQAQVEYELELSRYAVAQEEWELIGPDAVVDERYRALALRKPQLKAAMAGLRAASNSLERAELDLKRTEIAAPFNAVVLDKHADRGQLVTPQTTIARLAGTDAFLVEASLPAFKLEYMRWPDADGQGGAAVKVEYDLGERGVLLFDGRVVRVLGNLAQSGRLARILVEVEDPLRLESDQTSRRLFAGAYVRCLIEGEEIAATFSLPSALVREGDKVWIMDENNQLDIRPVDTIWRQGDRVLIAEGITAGERIVSSHIAVPMPGASLREKGVQAAGGPQKGKKGDEL